MSNVYSNRRIQSWDGEVAQRDGERVMGSDRLFAAGGPAGCCGTAARNNQQTDMTWRPKLTPSLAAEEWLINSCQQLFTCVS